MVYPDPNEPDDIERLAMALETSMETHIEASGCKWTNGERLAAAEVLKLRLNVRILRANGMVLLPSAVPAHMMPLDDVDDEEDEDGDEESR